MNCITMYSGGVYSYVSAKRAVERHGPDKTKLLFADTGIEDEDLYEFLDITSKFLGCELIRISAGKTPWQLFNERKFIGNSQTDICSLVLKRELMRRWVIRNCDYKDTVLNYGLGWHEPERLWKQKKAQYPFKVVSYVSEPPMLDKCDILRIVKADGIKIPRLYEMGFAHNNCGGFCIKAGQASFALLLKHFPERYKQHEEQEQQLMPSCGGHTIMRKRLKDSNGKTHTTPLSMREFRESVERGEKFDEYEFGGCGCALD